VRALKITLLSLIGLLALILITIVIVTATIDPNDYKADIEKAATENTTLTLSINGDLGWSFLPLGIDVNGVELIQQNGKPFTKLNKFTAQVGLVSLLQFNPQVHKIILDGLELTLEKDKNGVANWENITKTKDVETSIEKKQEKSPSPSTKVPETSEQAQATEKKLKLEVEEVAITNTTIHYIDKQTNQSVSLKNFNLLANSIALSKAFPLDINFSISNSSPQLDIEAHIKAAITIDENLKLFSVTELASNYKLAGEPLQGNTVNAAFNGHSIIADLEKDTLSLENIALTFANITLNTDTKITNLTKQVQLDGALSISEFSPQKLLSTLGQATIETTDPDVLQKVAFSTNFKGSPEDIALTELIIKLDDTAYTGAVNYRSAGQFLKAILEGSAINIDRYLPPPADPITQLSQAASPDNGATTTATKVEKKPAPEAPLLPLELIRSLNLDINFKQQQLIAKNLTLNELILQLSAANGVVSLTEASGKLYDGSFKVVAEIDAKTDNPKWKITKKVKNIQIMPLLKDLQDLEVISGGINLNADIKTTGNTVSALRSTAKGKADFNFDEGALHGFNLTKLTCEGFALINRDNISKTDWPEKTDFQSMQGKLTINGNQFNNNSLNAAISGIALNGKGLIDAEALSVDYGVDLKVVGNLGDDACRVNDKVKDLAIPVICKGSLTEDPAKLCKLDYSRIESLAIEVGKKELERKADKEVDKQLDKYLGDDNSETKKDVKKFFKKFF